MEHCFLTSYFKEGKVQNFLMSRFSPEVTADDAEKSLKEQLNLKKLVCTRLKSKFNIYASLNVSVIEDEFPLIHNTGVWPTGYLIAPFYGKPTPDHVFFSSTPVTGDIVHPNSSNRQLGGSSHPSRNCFDPQRFRYFVSRYQGT
jgi:hypothetical protein